MPDKKTKKQIKKEKEKEKTAKTKLIIPLWKKITIGLSFGIGFLIAVLLITFGIFNIFYADKIYPRVYSAGISLGGKTADKALTILKQTIEDAKKQKVVVTFSDGKSWTKSLDELGFNPDEEKTIQDAALVGRRKNWLESLVEIAQMAVMPIDVEIVNSYNKEKINGFITQIAKDINSNEKDATLSIKKGKLIEVAAQIGKKLEEEKTQKQIIAALTKANFKPIQIEVIELQPKVFEDGLAIAKDTTNQILATNLALKYKDKKFEINQDQTSNWIDFSAGNIKVPQGKGYFLESKLNDEKIKKYVKNIAAQIDQPAINAKITISNGKAIVFQPSQQGVVVNQEKIFSTINSQLLSGISEEITIEVEIKKPEVSESSINDLGINELIGEATTSFAKSPDNRIHNIQNGANFLNGQLIKPGDTFSAIGALGKIDNTTGYLPELVIKENKTQPEFGGGLCQVSTTLFRAALNAGLPIVERQNHSWRISYYEPPVGLDATIYMPKPDLKIKNDTPGWILIQNSVDTNTKKITFQFYGTKDGRTSKIIGPTLLYSTPAPASVYVDDPSLPQGEEKQIQKPHNGGKATATYRVFDKTGKIINEQIFVSIYKAAAAQYARGTGPVPEQPTQ